MKTEESIAEEVEGIARKFAAHSKMKFSEKIPMYKSRSLQAIYFFELAAIAYEHLTDESVSERYIKYR